MCPKNILELVLLVICVFHQLSAAKRKSTARDAHGIGETSNSSMDTFVDRFNRLKAESKIDDCVRILFKRKSGQKQSQNFLFLFNFCTGVV